MVSRYAKIAANIDKLFASDLFVDATITRASTTYDPRTLGATKAPATIPCRAVAETITTKAASGALVRSTVITTNREPKTGDKLTFGASSYVIDQVSVEAPDGTPLLWRSTVKA